MVDRVKITRAIFHLEQDPSIAAAEFVQSDPDQVEQVLKKHGVKYWREDEQVSVLPQAANLRVMFRLG